MWHLLFVIAAALLAYVFRDGTVVTVQATRRLECSKEAAFSAVTNFDTMKELSIDVIGYEFSRDSPPPTTASLGLQFSERRRVGDGEILVTNLTVTEYNQNNHVRTVTTEAHGTAWDTVFHVGLDEDDETLLEIKVVATPHSLPAKLRNPFARYLFSRGIDEHMDAIQEWCKKKKSKKGDEETIDDDGNDGEGVEDNMEIILNNNGNGGPPTTFCEGADSGQHSGQVEAEPTTESEDAMSMKWQEEPLVEVVATN